jgi:hypothetical protein
MDEPQRWGRSRCAALLSVFALHLVALTSLLIAAKTRLAVPPARPPIELLILPQTAAPAAAPPAASVERRRKLASNPSPTPPESLGVVALNSNSDVTGPPIDWAQEARNEAASVTKDSATIESMVSTPANSAFAEGPLHHKGEQLPTADGRWLVFVSDNCYQVSQSITAITNATNTGVGLQTYCTQKSRTPRGDLFEQLPAFKKLHPDN